MLAIENCARVNNAWDYLKIVSPWTLANNFVVIFWLICRALASTVAEAEECLRSRKLQVNFSKAKKCHEIEIKSDCDIGAFSLISMSQLVAVIIQTPQFHVFCSTIAMTVLQQVIGSGENSIGMLIDYQIVKMSLIAQNTLSGFKFTRTIFNDMKTLVICTWRQNLMVINENRFALHKWQKLGLKYFCFHHRIAFAGFFLLSISHQ